LFNKHKHDIARIKIGVNVYAGNGLKGIIDSIDYSVDPDKEPSIHVEWNNGKGLYYFCELAGHFIRICPYNDFEERIRDRMS